MAKQSQENKVARNTSKMGTGESRNPSNNGTFTVNMIRVTGISNDKKSGRKQFQVIGTTGHKQQFRTAGECQNFIQLVFKRRVDPIAFNSGVLEFVDDGQLTRAQKTKLAAAKNQLVKARDVIDGAKRLCLTGDPESDVNQRLFAVLDDNTTSLDDKIQIIGSIIQKGLNPDQDEDTEKSEN